MKTLIIFLLFILSAPFSFCQETHAKVNLPDSTKKMHIVEASCGSCKLGLPGKSCDLAVRINGSSFYVDGANIDSFGDAHAYDGFCNAIRKAEVQGEVKEGRFIASYFKLLPEENKK